MCDSKRFNNHRYWIVLVIFIQREKAKMETEWWNILQVDANVQIIDL